jgi:hypothetical protein
MSFAGNFVCSSFKQDLMAARHNFLVGGHSFKMALYTNAGAAMNAATTAYTTSGEIVGAGYTAGGMVIAQQSGTPNLTGTIAWSDFADATWLASTITNARGALIYNDSATTPVADASVVVLDFGSDKSSAAGDFTVVFPTADSSNAIIRIA